MTLKNHLTAHLQHGRIRVRWIVVILMAIDFFAVAAVSGRQFVESSKLPKADRYYIRVSSCDDGGRAYMNGTLVVDVGFDEDSNWLDITEDLVRGKNEIKFEVLNKTGAITYILQVKKNNTIVFEQACGKVKVVGCENNRAFRVGVAREFTYTIHLDD